MEKIVIFDVGNSDVGENKLFDRSFVYPISHTFLPICYLYEVTKNTNITLITPDIFLKSPEDYKNKNVFLISSLANKNTEKIISLGAKPLLLLCLESPFIATRFYLSLNKISRLFKYSYVFSGMRKRLSDKTHYRQMFFPQSPVSDLVKTNFKEKRLITMISSAKSIGDWKKDILLKLSFGRNVKEIYSERIKSIKYFSQNNEFDLYGYSWDKINVDKNTKDAISKSYKGTVDNKHQSLEKYKFALTFENSIFEGYVTEKIFDCFFVGVVPIYYGAPDIEKYVPKNTFIDFRKFNNYSDLNNFINNITEEAYLQYQNNIKKFLSSEQFHLFSEEKFANNILSSLNQE